MIQRYLAGYGPAGHRAVMLQEGVAVGAVHEGDIQHFGAIQRLLHAVADGVIIVLRLDEGQGDVGLVIEDVVGPAGDATPHRFTANHDPALGEIDLLAHLRHEVPLVPVRPDQSGRDELGPNVRLGQCLLIHGSFSCRSAVSAKGHALFSSRRDRVTPMSHPGRPNPRTHHDRIFQGAFLGVREISRSPPTPAD